MAQTVLHRYRRLLRGSGKTRVTADTYRGSMTALATEIYQHLRKNPQLTTYGELAAAVSSHPRSRRFHAALTEVSHSCRAEALPCLPALVQLASASRPSSGYFAVAHPRAKTAEAQERALVRELAAIKGARYPRVLP